MAGFVTAIWFELIFFAPRALSEPIALAPLMGAVWLLVARRAPPGPWQFAFAGLSMGLSFVARIHYAPALLALAVFTAKRDWRGAWTPPIASGPAASGLGAAAHLGLGGGPFQWAVETVRNKIAAKQAEA